MALSQKEFERLKGLHEVCIHIECFSCQDAALEIDLWCKASSDQRWKVCEECANDYHAVD